MKHALSKQVLRQCVIKQAKMIEASRDDVRSILDMTIELVVHVWMKHALSKQALRQIVTKKGQDDAVCAH